MKPTDPPPPGDRASARQSAPSQTSSGGTPDAPHEHGHDLDELHNEGVAHEHSDVNVRAILSFAAIITVVSIVCAAVVWGMFGVFERQAVGREPRMSPLVAPSTQMPATTAGSPFFGGPQQQPQLLTNERAALRLLRDSEDKQLHQYGWVNQTGGVVQMPIENAKKLLAERGLPARAGGTDPQLGTHAPARGESAGGRSNPTRPQAPGAAPAEPPPSAPAAPHAPGEAPAHGPAGRGGGA